MLAAKGLMALVREVGEQCGLSAVCGAPSVAVYRQTTWLKPSLK
ncbi:hypothetical protein ALTERO38_90314 [Alteromonas sp. 38]|nr:hypothetical protein ALTER154_10135 [Alteromonas sp. 154]VXC54774.1 hypothetical protein ALTERO38_90314 [Alteromonas sp. 38]